MVRPGAPLVRHAAVQLSRSPGAGWVATGVMHTLPFCFQVENTPDGPVVVVNVQASMLAPLRAVLTRYDWGYGGQADLQGFPYQVALLRGYVLELWSEPPVKSDET